MAPEDWKMLKAKPPARLLHSSSSEMTTPSITNWHRRQHAAIRHLSLVRDALTWPNSLIALPITA